MSANNRVTLLGKIVWGYDSKNLSTPDDIARYLRRFQLNEALALIGEVSSQHSENLGRQPSLLHGVPISNGLLAYTAMRLIEKSNDFRRGQMTAIDLAKALDMYYGLNFITKGEEEALSYLMRLGASQFDYDINVKHLVPRTLLLYGQLWPTVKKAQTVDVLSATKNMSGLDLRLLIAFGLAYTTTAKKGFVRPYLPDQSVRFAGASGSDASIFLQYVSGTYSQFRTLAQQEPIPSPHLEPFRSNPIQWHPLIVPDRQPEPTMPNVYLAPIPPLILKRVTSGLYTALSEHFRGEGGNNALRSAFGYVFEAYVGRLLEKSLIKGTSYSEIAYSKGHNSEKLSADWMVLEGDRLVIIEVKQAGLRRRSKTWGDLNDIVNDLIKTLGKAVQQIYQFEKDIKSNEYSALANFANVTSVERLIVTYDESPFNNWIIQEQISEGLRPNSNTNLPPDYTYHVASVEEFEYMVASCGTSLFDFLNAKSTNQDFKEFDFRDYLSSNNVVPRENAYLEAVFNDYTNDFLSFGRQEF